MRRLQRSRTRGDASASVVGGEGGEVDVRVKRLDWLRVVNCDETGATTTRRLGRPRQPGRHRPPKGEGTVEEVEHVEGLGTTHESGKLGTKDST